MWSLLSVANCCGTCVGPVTDSSPEENHESTCPEHALPKECGPYCPSQTVEGLVADPSRTAPPGKTMDLPVPSMPLMCGPHHPSQTVPGSVTDRTLGEYLGSACPEQGFRAVVITARCKLSQDPSPTEPLGKTLDVPALSIPFPRVVAHIARRKL